jgi:osmoprotectant transport system substrate-binding protein
VTTTRTSGRSTRIAVVIVASAAAVSLAACSSSSKTATSSNPLAPKSSAAAGSIVIGSNNLTESTLVADIYGVTLKAQGVKVTYKYNIGSREVTYGLLKNGDIQLMPEYNGALLAYLDKTATPTTVDQTDSLLSAQLAPGLEALTPSPAQDKDSLTVNAPTAAKYHLTSASTIADLAPFADQLTVGAAPEFQTRQEGLIGLAAEYGLHFKGFKALDPGGPLTEGALKANNIQVGDIFTTDTTITADKWVVLQDPKNLFGFQNITPVGQKTALTPAITAALNAVSAKLDTATLLQLDSQVGSAGADPLPVATAWLKSVGLPN